MATLEEVRRAKLAAVQALEAIDGVNGVGITKRGRGYALKVNCARADVEPSVPDTFAGVPVVVETVGPVRGPLARKRPPSAKKRQS